MLEPSREHVCGASVPPLRIGLEAQRRLCLGIHEDCVRYQSARAAYAQVAPTLPTRPLARTAPVILERARPAVPIPQLVDRRALGQLGLVVLMVMAVAALVVARIGGNRPGVAGSGASAASPTPEPTLAASPTQVPSASSIATPAASLTLAPPPTPRPTLAWTRTYRVKSGDTLLGIAAQFGTTATALASLNDISNPSLLRIGQILKIP